jgi:hypothetical protein
VRLHDVEVQTQLFELPNLRPLRNVGKSLINTLATSPISKLIFVIDHTLILSYLEFDSTPFDLIRLRVQKCRNCHVTKPSTSAVW